ncbi:response regulator transcription factor [Elusimicrobiota bacterium]
MAKKILLIEDDIETAEIVVEALGSKGYEVKAVGSGDEGLRLADSFRPDLVITDIMMEGTHGYQVIEELRRERDSKTLPIMVVSAKAFPPDVQVASELGADAFLAKPFELRKLMEKVAELLGD